MKALPFLTAPAEPTIRRCGTAATGILEFPVYGGITVAEADTISDLMASSQSSFVQGARLAETIAKVEDISISEAFTIIELSMRGVSLEDAAEAIRQRHEDAINNLALIYAAASKRNMTATVTALVRHRLNLPNWGIDDTGTLLQPLFNDIWALAEEEQDAEHRGNSEPPGDEMLGKPPVASGAPRKRTGSKSAGS